jgi:hypothetical protein
VDHAAAPACGLGQSVILGDGTARQGALGLRSGHGWNSSIDDRSGLFMRPESLVATASDSASEALQRLLDR